jgi:phosphohistidine swiveling domain-containing protein
VTVAATLVVPLLGRGAQPSQVGGKGAWLDRLAASGFAVPPAAAITTEAYRLVAGGTELEAFLSELRGRDPGSGDRHDAQARVDEAFLTAPLPPEVHEAITAAAATARGGSTSPVAARSSATAEDMAATSFAGQYRSFLDLESPAELERAVRLIWASLWYPAPRTYRRVNAVDESRLGMAVVVMPMVPAERAGVAFTVDPAGVPDAVRVEAVEGLGEGLVSGRVTPTAVLVPRDPAHRADLTADEPLACEVAALALEVEEAFGAAQDVEWAWDGQSVVLLQARPITTGTRATDDGFDSRTPPDERWTTVGITEMLPGVLPPLRWQTIGFLVEEALREWFADLECLGGAALDDGLLGRFRGRPALRLDALERMTGGAPEDIERQYFGRPDRAPATAGDGTTRAGRWRRARHDVLVLRARRRAFREADVVLVAVDECLATPTSPHLTPEELLVYRRRLLDLGARAVAVEAALAACAIDAYQRLEQRLAAKLGERDAARWAQRLTARAGLGGGPLAGAARVLAGGADDPNVVAASEHSDTWAEAFHELGLSDEGRRVSTALLELARRAGSASVFAGPTWSEEMDRVWAVARLGEPGPLEEGAGPEGPVTVDPEAWQEVCDELRALPGWSSTRVLTGQVVDVRLSNLRRQAEDAVDLLDRRERVKSAVLALGGEVRRVHLALGQALVARDRLEHADDVELLAERELAEAVAGRGPSGLELGRRWRWVHGAHTEAPLPPRFTGWPPARSAPTPAGDTLQGWGAGPGRYTGPARVVRAPSEGALRRGDVLVARTTDPSWSPLFLQAGAIVVEEGGPLSHAAIVARELGIPAVLNVPGALARLEGGDHEVSVDGDEGTVVVLAPGSGNRGGPEGSPR